MPPTLEPVFTRCPYAFKAILRQCHLCLCVLSFVDIRKVVCQAAGGNFGASWTLVHVQDTLVSGGSFPGVLGSSWDPSVVRGWIWKDFGVPLDFTLEVNSNFFVKQLIWPAFSANFCHFFLGDAF